MSKSPEALAGARWRAVINYRTENGTVDVEHWLNEISDLDDLVELGPHWDTIERIIIERVNHNESETMTVEEAQRR